jgi:hypothetical protein
VSPNPISEYLDRVERSLSEYENVSVERYEEEILTPRRANLRIRLRFNGIHLLEINEAIVLTDNELEFLDYRYHFQDEQNHLIFRYDSTPHFPDLPTFPHHKHLPSNVIASWKPDIERVLQEAADLSS